VNAAIAELQGTRAPPARIGQLYLRLGRYLTRAGRDGESRESMRHAETLIPPEPPTAARAHILAIIAGDLLVRGRYSEALDGGRTALEAARRAGAPKQEAAARNVIGSVLVSAGQDIGRGIDELQRAIAIGRDIGDTEEVVIGAINLSDCLIRIGRYDETATVALDAAEAGRRSGVARSEAGYVMLNAGGSPDPGRSVGSGRGNRRASTGVGRRCSGRSVGVRFQRDRSRLPRTAGPHVGGAEACRRPGP
jgi:tetratricopeptide (TPR) repeat protein